ncbi:MAG: efflux transporter outer membrane subunit, partial [Steroidobacteraceae bacterium]
ISATMMPRNPNAVRIRLTKGVVGYVPLKDLASIKLTTGAAWIYHEGGERFIPVKFSIRGRDLGSAVAEAQARIASHVRLPPGYRMEWSGEYGELKAAQRRLEVIVPVSLVLILGLLYTLFNSIKESLLSLTGIPFAVAGGVLGLYLTGRDFSISAAIGFISLFGVSVMIGILLLNRFNREPVTYNFHTAQVTVGFVPDVFGVNRRQVESLQAQTDAARYQLDAAYVTLASNVVAAALQEASTRAQIGAVQAIIRSNQRSLQILRRQLQLGYAARLEVAQQQLALAQAQALLPPLKRQLAQTRDLIKALAGNAPDQDVPETFTLDSLHLPKRLPLSLPSRLIEQRPDVLAAEEQVRAASAQVGVAVANRLPQFALTAALGGQATRITQMFWNSGTFWSVLGAASEPLFDAGTLRHRQSAAEQALAQAAAQYRSTVLTAFQNVADTLHALYSDADALKAAVAVAKAAKVALDVSRQQYQVGYANYLTVLTAQAAYQQTVIARVQAQAARLGDTAALFQALGGGWWNAQSAVARR